MQKNLADLREAIETLSQDRKVHASHLETLFEILLDLEEIDTAVTERHLREGLVLVALEKIRRNMLLPAQIREPLKEEYVSEVLHILEASLSTRPWALARIMERGAENEKTR